MELEQLIELIHRSSQRMMDALELERTSEWHEFMCREAGVHLERTRELQEALKKARDI
jgi:hypothetical protein